MRIITHLLSLTLATSLAGCASIVSGSGQKVQISTIPATQSTCAVANKIDNWSVVVPGQIDLKRSKSDLQISCIDRTSGYTGTQAVESGLEPWFIGNVIFGGIIGGPIDFMTGAAWKYPETVTVTLKPTYQPAYSAPGIYNQPAVSQPTTPQATPNSSYAPSDPLMPPATY